MTLLFAVGVPKLVGTLVFGVMVPLAAIYTRGRPHWKAMKASHDGEPRILPFPGKPPRLAA